MGTGMRFALIERSNPLYECVASLDQQPRHIDKLLRFGEAIHRVPVAKVGEEEPLAGRPKKVADVHHIGA